MTPLFYKCGVSWVCKTTLFSPIWGDSHIGGVLRGSFPTRRPFPAAPASRPRTKAGKGPGEEEGESKHPPSRGYQRWRRPGPGKWLIRNRSKAPSPSSGARPLPGQPPPQLRQGDAKRSLWMPPGAAVVP